jgi:site-specific recombinase
MNASLLLKMQKPTLYEYVQVLRIKSYHDDEAQLILRKIISYIRPTRRKKFEEANVKMGEFVAILQNDLILQNNFADLVANVIIEANITDLLTENGIVTGATFAQQAKRIINEKIIPPYEEPEEISTILNIIFYKKWDWQWLNALHNEPLHFLELIINNAIQRKKNDLTIEISNAAKVVSYRIASLGLEKEILIRANKKDSLITPFTEQNIELNKYLEQLGRHNNQDQLLLSIENCKDSLSILEKNSIATGTSINQTFILRRLLQNINRLSFILNLMGGHKEKMTLQIVHFIKSAVFHLKRKNDLSNFISNNLNLLAYRIVEHKKDTGDQYITSTRSEYFKMFAAACGGGFIISIMVMLKFKIGTLHLPLFWEGFLFSMNYALGFIVIQLLGFTVATKQPAMTAAALSNSLKGTGMSSMVDIAITASRVCRTQFVSILGNLLMVIPFTFLWLYLYEHVTGITFLNEAAALKQLTSNHPLLSFSLLFAATAGVFLFISGIVTGYVENRMVYAKIPERLPKQPILRRLVPKRWLQKAVNFLAHRSGAILGNATLGILLGMSSFFGKIFGLPIDIRHVTFAAGNVVMGVYGGGSNNIAYILACIGCVILIGLLNLIVSFTLAFYLAIKAQNMHLSDYPQLGKVILKHFLKTPKEFFFPPKKGKSSFTIKPDEEIYKSDLGIS